MLTTKHCLKTHLKVFQMCFFKNYFVVYFVVDLTEGVIYEAWFDIGPDSNLQSLLANKRFLLDHPDSRGILSIFQSPRDIADKYGIKMVTYYNVSKPTIT